MGERSFDDAVGERRVDEPNRDPGADLDAEGKPDVADESTPGKGEVPDPEVPVAPTDVPTMGTASILGEQDEERTDVEAAIAAEETDGVVDDRDGPAEHAALPVEDEKPPLDGDEPTAS
jgi:hypothetical protein